jgi:hypothetical protein
LTGFDLSRSNLLADYGLIGRQPTPMVVS